MKTIDLIKKLKPQHRARVLNNSTAKDLERDCTDLAEAVALSFVWSTSPEGSPYWTDVCGQLTSGEYTFTEEESKERESPLPTEAAKRKEYVIFSGFINYFPNAIAAVSHLSYKGSQQHHPDQPLHWDKSKSSDELDALMRHMIDGDWEQVAWRAMSNLERKLTGHCQYEKANDKSTNK